MTDDKKEPEEEVRVDLLEWYKPFEKVCMTLTIKKSGHTRISESFS
jgi:hypothetical protein